MRTLRKILVGVDLDEMGDLTPGSLEAAREASRLATRTGACVEFSHSAHPETGGPARSLASQAQEILTATCQAVRAPGCRVEAGELLLSEEPPATALIRKALEEEFDLLVVAKRNHGRRRDRRLGSVSMALIQECPLPVLVVKPDPDPESDPDSSAEHRYVLAATDLEPVGDDVVDLGGLMADAYDCELGILHAWQMPMDLQLGAARIGEAETKQRKEAIADAAQRHIRGLDRVKNLGDRCELFIACDSPSDAIREICDARRPHLVVLGSVSRGGIPGFLLGNTAEKLLYQLDCSLLTLKPRNFVHPFPTHSGEAQERRADRGSGSATS